MESFDCPAVGAGSAGSVIAQRLSKYPGVRVLLIEAGQGDWQPKCARWGGCLVLIAGYQHE